MAKEIRHVMGLSGGKDSTALAVFLREHPDYADLDIEYFFCDTHKELKETYDYLDRIETYLGITIKRLEAKRGFDHWLDVYGGVLPSPQLRWCTKQMKIIPFEKFVGDDEVISYIGIRADENRDGYISSKPNITPVFPFKDHGLVKRDIINLLEDSRIGMPEYYKWRSRSGCFFCFFQRKYEWVMLAEHHPELFQKAIDYEEKHSDGRNYTWTQGETLLELLERKEEIINRYHKSSSSEVRQDENQALTSVLEDIFEDDSEELPCLMCHL